MYCDYCDSLVSRDRGVQPETLAKRERAYRCCDRCGYFSRPSEFMVFYFYFLLVIYGFRWGTSEMCNSCMRREAWKMLGANLIFLLGIPVAVYQLVRAYFGGSTLDPVYAGLDGANAAAKSGRTDKAVAKYRAMEERLGHCAGVRFNRGLTLLSANRGQDGAQALEEALNDCANYAPAYEALAQVYAAMGRTADVQALRAMYNSSAGLDHPATQPAGRA
jgi:tetratricopeptide (TPR) repeat protein